MIIQLILSVVSERVDFVTKITNFFIKEIEKGGWINKGKKGDLEIFNWYSDWQDGVLFAPQKEAKRELN